MRVKAQRSRQVLHRLPQPAGGCERGSTGDQAVIVIRAHPQRLRVCVDGRLGVVREWQGKYGRVRGGREGGLVGVRDKTLTLTGRRLLARS